MATPKKPGAAKRAPAPKPAPPADAPGPMPPEFKMVVQQREFLIRVVNAFAARMAGELVARGLLPIQGAAAWTESELATVREGMTSITASFSSAG